ncbi:MAG: cytochrome c biogenesis protein CcsA [Bacteroidales bacterium]|nr:cytochrome c biogenesis protein CcsA [Bacteroidales bacterium]
MAAIILMMMAATVVEKVSGPDKAFGLFYHSPLFILLWAVAVISGLVWLFKSKAIRRPAVAIIHLSFVLILVGALVTHLTSRTGLMKIRVGETVSEMELEEGGKAELPFSITLKSFEVSRYPGSEMPMDYSSTVLVNGSEEAVISMNKILKTGGYRFYQSAYDEDENGTILTVSDDPWGVTLTYIGYFCLLVGLVSFFFDSKSTFRRALSRLGKGMAVIALILGFSHTASAAPKVLPEDVAEQIGDLYVYYNGRICPLQTMARDYVMKVYGKPSVGGYTTEQVFTGWMFYGSSWADVPMKIKKKEVGTAKEAEKIYAFQSACAQKIVKVFPYEEDGKVVWYSSAQILPVDMDTDTWTFIKKCFPYLGELFFNKDYEEASRVIAKMRLYQEKVASDVLPDASHLKAEKIYNKLGRPMMLAMICVTLGMIVFIWMGLAISRRRRLPRPVVNALSLLSAVVGVYLTVVLGLRWFVQGHIPMAGGFEMMLLIAWMSSVFTAVVGRRFPVIQPLGLMLAGFAMLVAVLGESNPRITPLMPVLSSPLLSIHVACMMISYTLFGMMALLGVMGLVVRNDEASDELAAISTVILYPAEFLLIIGTFLGAIWANVSWGTYWSWDPKETWALVTLLVYAAAMHKVSLKALEKPRVMHVFAILAFLCVLITYFGVNFILGGLHSYAS